MCAVLNDFPVVQHQNLIGISYGFQTVSNHNDGLASGQGFDGLLQLRLVLGVNIGRGLVQNDDRRVLKHGPCDGEPLAFSAGDRGAALTDDGTTVSYP